MAQPKVGDLYVYAWSGPSETYQWSVYKITKRELVESTTTFENTLSPVLSLINDERSNDVFTYDLRGWRKVDLIDIGMMRLKLDNFLREEMIKRSK